MVCAIFEWWILNSGCRAKWFLRLSKEEKQAALAAGDLLMGTGGRQFLPFLGRCGRPRSGQPASWASGLTGVVVLALQDSCPVVGEASPSSEVRHHRFIISLL